MMLRLVSEPRRIVRVPLQECVFGLLGAVAGLLQALLGVEGPYSEPHTEGRNDDKQYERGPRRAVPILQPGKPLFVPSF